MSEMAANDRVSRSFALEQTYVHEVYEKYYDNPHSKPWPKVQEFLDNLEPGAFVCDVGCGNGKYLKVNKSIYSLGGEKSIRLSDLARRNQNEVIRLDNLALPFKDNSFDTVLSLSVIHHFATTDRRVNAIREMARILRVGGRMIITVWAMEQEHRKFESQDVLVPWRRPKLRTACEVTSSSTTNSEEDFQGRYRPLSRTDGESNKPSRFRNTFKRRLRTNHQHQNGKHRPMDPYRKTSSGSSSLSSPSETCYGFVRRALQKIAGGGRRVVANSWFLDNWIACMHKQQPLNKRYDPDGCEYCECSSCDTVEDQPIELLRIDDEEPKQIPRRQTCPVSQMSADIDAFKSRSMNNIRSVQEHNNNNNNNNHRCKLAKSQQPSQNQEKLSSTNNTLKKPKLVKQKKSVCEEDADEALDQPTDMKDLIRALPDFKSSLSRYDRGSVLKQRSLNEEMLSTDRLREKERLKQNIQKQTSLNEDLIYKRSHAFESLKDSFFAVASSKGFQMFKNGLTSRIKNSTTMEKVANASLKNGFVKIFQTWKGSELKSPTTRDGFVNLPNCHAVEPTEKCGERRHSKEDGSDSSKDSSLQSDTSVDSEDSFASVIFVPKSDPMSPIGGASFSAGPTSPLLKGSCQSAPQSPRIKQSSCPTSPRVKQIPNGMHPLTKQLSSPKPSTEFLSTTTAFFPADSCDNSRLKCVKLLPVHPAEKPNAKLLAQKYSVQPIPQFRRTTLNTPTLRVAETFAASETVPANPVPTTKVTSPDKSPPDHTEASRAEKLKKIREMLAQKPGFGTKTKTHCPIVRKISDPEKKEQSLVKPIPKLLKLEIFNPEEDDDSDNSCVSSPDSVGSGNSVKRAPGEKFQFPESKTPQNKAMSLLEAAANVANSLDEAVEKVISSRPKKNLSGVDVFSIIQGRFSSSDVTPLLDEDEDESSNGDSRRSSSTWNEECQRHLTAFADKLSEKLMKELDEYQITMDNLDDPYIHRLSEELHDLSILSEEIKKQNEYLSRLSQKRNHNCLRCSGRRECCCGAVVTSPTPNRTRTRPNRSVTDTAPCVNNNSANPALGSVSSKCANGRFSSCGVNSNVPKIEESLDQNGYSDLAEAKTRLLIGKGSSSSESFDSSDKGSSSNSLVSSGATSINYGGQSIASSVTDLTLESRDGGCGSNGSSTASLVSIESRSRSKSDNVDTLSPGHLKKRDASGLSDISADSWPPDEIGGDITYHRYYHVFRQGELEKLIEKYVDDLHVVSSTYEHASWCIIAEKVQIWTI